MMLSLLKMFTPLAFTFRFWDSAIEYFRLRNTCSYNKTIHSAVLIAKSNNCTMSCVRVFAHYLCLCRAMRIVSRQYEHSDYSQLLSELLAQHCPRTVGTLHFVSVPDCPVDQITIFVNAT